MPTNTTTKRPLKVQSGTALRRTFQNWIKLRAEETRLSAALDETKKLVLLPSLEVNGEEDEKGSQWIEFDNPVEVEELRSGKTVTVSYTGIKRERRVSQSFDEVKAEALLRSKGLWLDEKQEKSLRTLLNAVPTLRVALSIDQDAFREAFYSKKITEEEFDSCFTDVVSYAFVPQKR